LIPAAGGVDAWSFSDIASSLNGDANGDDRCDARIGDRIASFSTFDPGTQDKPTAWMPTREREKSKLRTSVLRVVSALRELGWKRCRAPDRSAARRRAHVLPHQSVTSTRHFPHAMGNAVQRDLHQRQFDSLCPRQERPLIRIPQHDRI